MIAAAVLIAWGVIAYFSDGARRITDRADAAALRAIAELRTDRLSDLMRGIARVGTGWTVTVVSLGVIGALILFKRWRHLFTFLGCFAVLAVIGGTMYDGFGRPRPYDVTTIGRWGGFSLPAPPAAVLAIVALSVAYSLVVPGRPRVIAKRIAAAVIALFVLSQLYLATYHPFDLLVGIALATALAVNGYRFFTPNEVFPVTYRKGKTAHLDVSGRRGDAVRQAVQDQLGLTVVDIKPVGLEGSAGSTPLRLKVAGDPDTYLFGKLYAMSHVRADRWYKLGRTILYGRLEDETPFFSVQNLVQYEDYCARLLRDSGIPTARPYGIVELTPGREYLLVTEFFVGAKEIGEAEVDDGVIDEGLGLVRKLWDAGLAHRDIKPANLLVRDGQVKLIDVFFVQVRPSPWRQAVDLANMMLVLAVRTDAQRVYERALRFFTPDDIAEAFAAARGIASPTQLRTAMKQDGRDLVRQFRALAPERRPIALQRWSLRRVTLALAVALVGWMFVSVTGSILWPTYNIQISGTPNCGTDDVMVLMAQAVPSATSVPCLAGLPAGWELGGVSIQRGEGRFWLASDRGGDHAVEATLRPAGECSVADAIEVPSDQAGLRRYEQTQQLPPRLRGIRYYLFPGGCITYRFAFDSTSPSALLFDAESALSFQPRAGLVDAVRERTGLRLCGAGASCPGGQ